jgi:hypothetical protein
MGGQRGGASESLPLEIRQLCSRHIVTSAARPPEWELSLRRCERWGLGAILRSIRVHYHAKSTSSATSQKVMSFVFRYFLASFPRFLCFCRLEFSFNGGVVLIRLGPSGAKRSFATNRLPLDHHNRLSQTCPLVKQKMNEVGGGLRTHCRWYRCCPQKNPSTVRQRLEKAPSPDTLPSRERAVLSKPRGAIRLPRKGFLAKLTNLVWRGRFVAAVVAFRAAGRRALNPIQSFKGVESSYGN